MTDEEIKRKATEIAEGFDFVKNSEVTSAAEEIAAAIREAVLQAYEEATKLTCASCHAEIPAVPVFAEGTEDIYSWHHGAADDWQFCTAPRLRTLMRSLQPVDAPVSPQIERE